MQRSTLKRKPPTRAPNAREGEFASWTPTPRAIIEHGWLRHVGALGVAPRQPAPILKTGVRKSQAIRDSARGEECSVRIVGACNFDPATSVWSHLPSIAGGRGMGMKAIDECGAVACSACHDVVDGRRPLPPGASATSVLLDWCFGHFRSLVILKQKGLI